MNRFVVFDFAPFGGSSPSWCRSRSPILKMILVSWCPGGDGWVDLPSMPKNNVSSTAWCHPFVSPGVSMPGWYNAATGGHHGHEGGVQKSGHPPWSTQVLMSFYHCLNKIWWNSGGKNVSCYSSKEIHDISWLKITSFFQQILQPLRCAYVVAS